METEPVTAVLWEHIVKVVQTNPGNELIHQTLTPELMKVTQRPACQKRHGSPGAGGARSKEQHT
jgi:hypothetical protein